MPPSACASGAGLLGAGRRPLAAPALGYNGLSVRHREGDGTTPSGTFGIGPVMYGTAPDPGVRFRYHRLVCGDWWDEDPVLADLQHLPTRRLRHDACASAAGSEALWRATDVYSTLAVVRYNADPVVRGAGSAIFLHADIGLADDRLRQPAAAICSCCSAPAAAVRRGRCVVIGTRSRIASLGLLQR